MNKVALESNYPGLTLRRFLRDIEDIQKFQTHSPKLALSHASVALSLSLFQGISENLLSGVPLSVQMGESEFFGHKFFVNKHVLIPRPETEYLVDLIAQEFRGKVKNVLDVGTGSGAILLSLLKTGVGEVGMGVDISPEALSVAQVNARRLSLGPQLLLSDRFSGVTGSFDLIVSNPPYIKAQAHRHLVHSSVNTHEPHEALYLQDDEFDSWFQILFEGVRFHLKGTFFMEGHELELEKSARTLTEMGFKQVKVLNDLTGGPRFLRATYGA